MIESRNPYIILGIPFGSSRELALTAFARKSRPLRRAGREGASQLTDLTWALSQVTELIKDPDANLALFRIPSDPDAFSFEGAGVMRPKPEKLERRYTNAEGALKALQLRASQEYLRYLTVLLSEHPAPLAP